MPYSIEKASLAARFLDFNDIDEGYETSNLHFFFHVIAPLFVLGHLAADQIMINILDRPRNGTCFPIPDDTEVNFA